MDSINKALKVLSVLKATEELNKLQLRIALELYGLEEALVNELASAAGVSAPAISRSVDELETLGFAKRIRDEKEDRRRVYVQLTNKGKKFIEGALE